MEYAKKLMIIVRNGELMGAVIPATKDMALKEELV